MTDHTPAPSSQLVPLSEAQIEAIMHVIEMRLCIIWPRIGAREAFANELRALEPPSDDGDVARCPICDERFHPSDLCADDITEGTCHAACLEGSPVVNMETEEEIPGGQATTYLYREVMEREALAAMEGSTR